VFGRLLGRTARTLDCGKAEDSEVRESSPTGVLMCEGLIGNNNEPREGKRERHENENKSHQYYHTGFPHLDYHRKLHPARQRSIQGDWRRRHNRFTETASPIGREQRCLERRHTIRSNLDGLCAVQNRGFEARRLDRARTEQTGSLGSKSSLQRMRNDDLGRRVWESQT